LFESRFGVEKIDMARSTFHEQEDDAFGFRKVMGFVGVRFGGVWDQAQGSVLAQEGLECQESESEPCILEHASSRGGHL
jgi:hypothetical protein